MFRSPAAAGSTRVSRRWAIRSRGRRACCRTDRHDGRAVARLRKVRKNHFLTIYGPFSSIFPADGSTGIAAFTALEPFSRGVRPLKMEKMEKMDITRARSARHRD